MCGRFALGTTINELPQQFIDSLIINSDENIQSDSSVVRNHDTPSNHQAEKVYEFGSISGNSGKNEVILSNCSEFQPSFNIAPTESAFIIYLQKSINSEINHRYVIEVSKFGLIPSWSKPKNLCNGEAGSTFYKDIQTQQARTFNCRKETLSLSQSIWNDCKRNNRRCVIPIRGYFEWQKTAKEKVPYFVYSSTSPLLYLAGLYSHNYNYSFETPKDHTELLSTFTIVTGPAQKADSYDISWLHSRKPLMLTPGSKEWFNWLDPAKDWSDEFLETCLNTSNNKSYKNVKAHTVSKAVGNTAAEGEYLIQEVKRKGQKSIASFFQPGNKRKVEDEDIQISKVFKREKTDDRKDIAQFFK